jgi:hypothetical protein
VRPSERCLEAMALPVEIWSPDALAERVPFRRFKHGHFALFTSTGGVLFAERILKDLGRWLTREGVPLHPCTRVTGVDPDRAAVDIEGGRTDRGDVLVVHFRYHRASPEVKGGNRRRR